MNMRNLFIALAFGTLATIARGEAVKVNAGASAYASPDFVGQSFLVPAANDGQMLSAFRFLDDNAAASVPWSGVLYLMETSVDGAPQDVAASEPISIGVYSSAFGGWIFSSPVPLVGDSTYVVYTSTPFSGMTGFGFGYGYPDGGLELSPDATTNYSEGMGGASANFEMTFAKIPVPVVKLTGKKSLKTAKAKITLRGKTTGPVTDVFYAVGKTIKPAKGTTSWNLTVKLKPGKNKITITAEGPGGTSASVTVKVLRE